MSTAKTVLIIGGVVVGGVVLYEVFKPGGVAGRKATTAPSTGITGAIISGLASAAPGIFANFKSPAGAGAYGGAAAGQGPSPTISPYHDVYADGSTSTTQGIDPTTGGAYLSSGQVYGPAAPGSVTASDDGLMAPTEF